MNRRNLFVKLGEWAAALGLGALLPTPGEARTTPLREYARKRGIPVLPHRVHWVSLDRRHIEGRIMGMTPDGKATVQVTVRPPVTLSNGSVVTTMQRIDGVEFAGYEPNGRPVPNTWHSPEPEGCARPAKPYAEWWYRAKPTDGQGELTPKPAPWFIKAEGAEAPLLARLHGPDNELLAYRIDDAELNEARHRRELELLRELRRKAGEIS